MKSRSTLCPQCLVLSARLETLEAKIAQLETQLATAKKDSTNSSKPPSSDIVKPPPAPTPDGTPHKIGGQPGHPKHERELFATDQITSFFEHKRECCPDCGEAVRRNGTLQRLTQQIDIQDVPITIEQHVQPEYWCSNCQKSCWCGLPKRIEAGGLIGPNLLALIAYLKGGCHASFSTIRKYLRDVMKVTIARSTLVKAIQKVSKALDGPYEELLELLPGEDILNVDETGHKNNQERWWTWCLRAELYTLYKIDVSRSSNVLVEVLGRDFAGVIGCDYFSAYRKYMRVFGVELQFCLAHLIRDVKYLTTLPDKATKQYGERLRIALKNLFEVINRREELSSKAFDRKLKAARDAVLRVGVADVPSSKASQNMAKRFRLHGESYFTFVTTPGVEPTNNLAEQAIRFVVIDRLITQGTRSESGRRWCERIWTVMATCSQQGRSVYEYLKMCIVNWYAGIASPSLLPAAAAT
jgi:transposase